MLGPIDYIIVGFKGNKFDGSILQALSDAINQGVIRIVDMSFIQKDADGGVKTIDMSDMGDEVVLKLTETAASAVKEITQDDVDEVAELLENNSAAGLLVIEQLWAKPLKQALINANGFLIAEGRIHPEAAEELGKKGA